MCDVFEQIYQRGYKKGFYSVKMEDTHKLMSYLKCSLEEAMNVLKLSEEEKEYIRELHQD